MVTPVRTSTFTPYGPRPAERGVTPAPAVPPPTGGTEPSPLIGVPKGQYGDPAWWKQRGGHELYAMFEQINKQNPWAARAFWQQVVGMGHGQNDLQAATIHKMFGGDMNAYNRWRNEPHSQGMEGRIGNFDLSTGKWSNANMYPGGNPYGDQDFTFQGWDPSKLALGLQSTPGNAEAGAESWKTYGAGAHFGTQGAQYPGVTEQANIAAGGTNPYVNQYGGHNTGPRRAVDENGLLSKNPGRTGGAPMAPPPAVPAPNTGTSPTTPGTSPTNPYGGTSAGGGYRFFQRN